VVINKNGSEATVEGFTRLTVSSLPGALLLRRCSARAPCDAQLHSARIFKHLIRSRALKLQQTDVPTRITYAYKESALVKVCPLPQRIAPAVLPRSA
jgi:hypothetical protein